MTLEELVEKAYEVSTTAIEGGESDNDIIPTFLIVGDDDTLHVVATMFDDDRSKDGAVLAVQTHALATNAKAYLFYSEAWAVTRSRDERIKGEVREQPDRVEIVQMYGEDEDGRSVMGRAEIHADRSGVGGLEVQYGSVGEQSTGRFTQLLPPESARTPENVARAREMVQRMRS